MQLVNNTMKSHKEIIPDIKKDNFDYIYLQQGLKFYSPENYIYVNQFLKEFGEFYELIGYSSDGKDNKFSENYVNFLQNVYLRSFEFLEKYNNILDKQEEDIDPEFESTIRQIMRNVNLYYQIDQDNEYKISTMGRMANLTSRLIMNKKVNENYNTTKHLYENLLYMAKKDAKTLILGK